MLIDHLIPLLKKYISDSKIIGNMTLGRTKCSEILKNVLYPVERKELLDILQNNYFSILLDESTDITDKKFLCLLVNIIIFLA